MRKTRRLIIDPRSAPLGINECSENLFPKLTKKHL